MNRDSLPRDGDPPKSTPTGPVPLGTSREEPRPAATRRALASTDLFQGQREVVILHRDEEYRLRITRAGKLILTK